MRKLLKKYGFVPDKLVTDDLRSYGAAASDLGIANRHERGRWRNNRAENSHQPTRRRERKMLGFKSLRFSAYVARPAAKSGPVIVVHPAARRDQASVTLILGHGAGAGQTSGFMVTFSTGLATLRRRYEKAGRIRVAHRFQTSSPLLARRWTRAALWRNNVLLFAMADNRAALARR